MIKYAYRVYNDGDAVIVKCDESQDGKRKFMELIEGEKPFSINGYSGFETAYTYEQAAAAVKYIQFLKS